MMDLLDLLDNARNRDDSKSAPKKQEQQQRLTTIDPKLGEVFIAPHRDNHGRIVRKKCAINGCDYYVRSHNSATCSNAHKTELRKQTEAKKKEESREKGKTKKCAFCGEEFVPQRRTQIYCDRDHYVNCEVCGKKIAVSRSNLGRPPRACCPSHAVMLGHTPESQAKRRENSLKKWGTETPLQATEVKAKIKKTFDEHPEKDYRFGSKNSRELIEDKYGVDNVSRLDSIKEKKRQRSQERYGTDFPAQSNEIKAKVKKTSMEKYGVPTALNLPENKEKAREAVREKYGVDYPFQSSEVRDKITQTNMDRYGVAYPLQSDEYKRWMREQCMERYGVDWWSRAEEVKAKYRETCKRLYGPDVINAFQAEPVKEKSKQTLLDKYGVENISQDPEKRAIATQHMIESMSRNANDWSHGRPGPVSKLNMEWATAIELSLPDAIVSFEEPIPGTHWRADLKVEQDDHVVLVDVNPTISHNVDKSWWCAMTGCKPMNGKPHKHSKPISESYPAERMDAVTAAGWRYVQIWDWDDLDSVMSVLHGLLDPVDEITSCSGSMNVDDDLMLDGPGAGDENESPVSVEVYQGLYNTGVKASSLQWFDDPVSVVEDGKLVARSSLMDCYVAKKNGKSVWLLGFILGDDGRWRLAARTGGASLLDATSLDKMLFKKFCETASLVEVYCKLDANKGMVPGANGECFLTGLRNDSMKVRDEIGDGWREINANRTRLLLVDGDRRPVAKARDKTKTVRVPVLSPVEWVYHHNG